MTGQLKQCLFALVLTLLTACSSNLQQASSESTEQILSKTLTQRLDQAQIADTMQANNTLDGVRKRTLIIENTIDSTMAQTLMPDNNRLITLKLRGAKLKTVLQLMLKMQQKIAVFDDSIKDIAITLNFEEMAWSQVFNALLMQQQLVVRQTEDKRSVYIDTRASFDAWLLQQEQNLLTNLTSKLTYQKIRNGEKILAEQHQLDKFDVFYADLDTLKTQLSAVFASKYLAVNQPLIVVDKSANALLISGSQSQLNLAQAVIDALDKKQPQVFVEVIIVSVGDDFAFQLGTQLSIQKKRQQTVLDEDNNAVEQDALPNVIDTQLGLDGLIGFSAIEQIGLGQLKVALDVLESRALITTLSNPKLLVKNDKQAKFIQGIQFPITTSVTDSNGNITENIEYKDANLQLEITPKIAKNGQISMRVLVKNDTLQSDDATINKMELDSELLLENNQIVVIGGLFVARSNDIKRQVPVLGEVPILGGLFRATEQTKNNSELLIFIVPSVMI